MIKLTGFWGFVKKNIFWFIAALVSAVVSGITRSSASIMVSPITDRLMSGTFSGVLFLCLAAIGLHFISYGLNGTNAFLGEFIQERFAYFLRIKLFNHLNKVKYAILEKYKPGELQSVFRNDIRTGAGVFDFIVRWTSQVSIIIACLVNLLRINVVTTLVVFVISVTFCLVSQGFLKAVRRYQTESRKSLGRLSNLVLNFCDTFDVLKTYTAKSFALKIFNNERNTFNNKIMSSIRADVIRFSLFTLVNNGLLCGTVIYLCGIAINGELMLGEVLVFLSLMRQLLNSTDTVFRQFFSFMSSLAALDRVTELFRLETETSQEGSAPAQIDNILVDGITFAYDNSTADKIHIFEDYSLNLSKGNAYILTGQSGSGKTTLIKILMGFYKCPEMKIQLDGGKSVDSLLNMTGFVPSDSKLFAMSLYENITLGSDTSKEECMRLAGDIGIADWINSLPDKLDTIIDENSRNLSGGQRQAICVLRALVMNSPVIIMDEPFAALDSDKENMLINIINSIKQNKIIVATSHRHSSVKAFDVVLSINSKQLR